nr:MAG TPA: hypothetical protein [Caudoviricetes sp.]
MPKFCKFCILSSHFLPYVHTYPNNVSNAICSTFLSVLIFYLLHKIYQNVKEEK